MGSMCSSPLHDAITSGDTCTVREILDEPGSFHIINEDSTASCIFNPRAEFYIPLHLAISHKNKELVRILINNGADVDSVNMKEQTALHKVVECGDLEILRLLLDAGATVNVQDDKGLTAIHYVAMSSLPDGVDCDMAKILVGATTQEVVMLKAADGKRAIDLARENGKHDLVVYFDEIG